jgi:hypothetical protein
MLPLVEPEVVDIVLVELDPDQPPGNIHVYEVAPLTVDIEYVLLLPEQIVVGPVMVPGVSGILLTDTARVCAVLEPQVLFAATVIFPPVVPAVVVILVVELVPVQPLGIVHE